MDSLSIVLTITCGSGSSIFVAFAVRHIAWLGKLHIMEEGSSK